MESQPPKYLPNNKGKNDSSIRTISSILDLPSSKLHRKLEALQMKVWNCSFVFRVFEELRLKRGWMRIAPKIKVRHRINVSPFEPCHPQFLELNSKPVRITQLLPDQAIRQFGQDLSSQSLQRSWLVSTQQLFVQETLVEDRSNCNGVRLLENRPLVLLVREHLACRNL